MQIYLKMIQNYLTQLPTIYSPNSDENHEKDIAFNAVDCIIINIETDDENKGVRKVIIFSKIDTKTSVWSEVLTGPRVDEE